MKKNFLILLPALALVFSSCGGGEEGDGGEKGDGGGSVNLDGMAEEDTLKNYGLNVSVFVPEELAPDGTQIPSQIEPDEPNMMWKLKSGRKFSIVIRVSDGEGKYIERKKKELEGGIFKIEYLDEKDNYIMYKATLPDGNTEMEFFKFYGVKKAGGEEYEFYSDESAELRKVDVEMMRKSFLAFGEEIVEE